MYLGNMQSALNRFMDGMAGEAGQEDGGLVKGSRKEFSGWCPMPLQNTETL